MLTQLPLAPLAAPDPAPALSARPCRRRAGADALDPRAARLRAALAAYHLDPRWLRAFAAAGDDLRAAFDPPGETPPEIAELCQAFAALLRPTPREQITSPDAVAALLMVAMGRLDHEQLWVVLLDTRNRVQRIEPVYQGNLSSTQIRIAEIFKPAIRLNSASLIVAHNHPSQDPSPSPEDVAVTRTILDAGKLLDVQVLDHLVIGRSSYVSMRARGLAFSA